MEMNFILNITINVANLDFILKLIKLFQINNFYTHILSYLISYDKNYYIIIFPTN